MDQRIFNKRNALIAGIVVGAVLLWRLYYILFVFHITSITPSVDDFSQYTPNIKVSFSQPLQTDGLTAVMEPNEAAAAYVNGKTLTVNFNPLTVNQSYTVTIKNITDKKGAHLPDKKITFKVKDIPYDQLPAAQKKADMQRQDTAPLPTQDKAYSYIPYSTLDYTLSLTEQNDHITISAVLILSNSDRGDSRDAAIATYKQEVIDYLKKSGLNPDDYTIEYSITEPTS